MGFYDFISSAGRKIGIGRAEASEPPSDAEVRGVVEQAVPNTQLQIRVEGDTVFLEGTVPDAASRERAIAAAGNIQGVARVTDTIGFDRGGTGSVETPTADTGQFYTVQPGDSLSKIAGKLYGDMNKYPAIFEANRGLIKDEDDIYPGWVLRIPPQD